MRTHPAGHGTGHRDRGKEGRGDTLSHSSGVLRLVPRLSADIYTHVIAIPIPYREASLLNLPFPCAELGGIK